MLKATYSQLSVPERISLVEEIWDSIPQDSPIQLSAQQKKELDKREDELVNGIVKPQTWKQIKAGLKRRKK
jgi:putative addiction module component (TIGR02574 family)